MRRFCLRADSPFLFSSFPHQKIYGDNLLGVRSILTGLMELRSFDAGIFDERVLK